MGCASWHPDFARKHRTFFMNIIHEKVPYEDLHQDNKWGYQYYISQGIKEIPIDYSNRLSIKNMIVIDNFFCHILDDKYYYSTNRFVSVYEIFHKYMNKYNKDMNEWYCEEMKELRNMHLNFKKKNSQYSSFTIDEQGLNYFTDAVIKLTDSEITNIL